MAQMILLNYEKGQCFQVFAAISQSMCSFIVKM